MALKRSTTRRRDWLVASVAGIASLVAYARTLAPTVLPGDSGELQLAAPLLGLAHPTGYPLYLILGKLWTVLVPLGDMAQRVNLLSAVLSAATVGLLYALGRRLGLGTAPALLACLILAFSRAFWSQAVRAEVYALNSLLTVLLLFLAAGKGSGAQGSAPYAVGDGSAQGSAPYTARRWYALLFVLGLSVAHHRLAQLLIPALVILAWPELRRAWPLRRPAGALFCLACLLSPLLLYLYIPLRAAATPYLRLPVGGGPDLVLYENTASDFIAMITGSVFRGSLGAADGEGISARFAMAITLLRQQVGWAGMALAAVGLLVAAQRARRLALALIVAYAALAGFCLVYDIGDIADLFTPSYIIVALLIGAGIRFLGEAASRAVSAPASVIVLAAAAALPLALLAGNWRSVDMSQQTTTRMAWESLLSEPLPAGAVLVSNDRDEMTPMWYMQYVEGKRSDLVGLFPKIRPDEDATTLGALLDWLLARGQRPYLIKPMPGLDIKYSIQQAGRLAQVTGHSAPAPVQPEHSVAASFGGSIELLGADVDGTLAPGGVVTVTLYWRPLAALAEDYHVFVQFVTAGGDRLQGSDHRAGDVFYPTSVWRSGDTLADRHVLALPAALPAGTYYLRTGVYRYPAMTRLPVTGDQGTTVDVATIRIP